MKKLLVAFAFVLLPSFAFAATDDQIQASLVQQLLSIFVVQVNGLDKMQSLVAQSSNPAQFNTFSGLLAQQLSETTAQLATLLNSQTVVLSLPQVNNTIAGSAPVQACTDNPSLSLYVSSSTANSVFITGQYTTGCNLNVNTKWVFKTDLWNVTGVKRDYNYGVIGHANEWDLQGAEGEQTYNIGYFRATINPYVGQKTATLTVGNLTATTTISQ